MIDTNKQITLAGEKADDFIRLGRTLAQKLRDAQNLRTLEAMAQELRTFSDAFDAYFGGENGEPGGSSLSTALWVAYDWQKTRLAGPQDARRDALAESFTRDFEDELDSRDWQANFHPNTETKF